MSFVAPAAFSKFLGRVPKPTVLVGHGGAIANEEITNNDVLLGRGSALDNHNGNKQLRSIVRQSTITICNKTHTKNEKTFEAAKVVATVRTLNPPGRFLLKNEATGFWEEVGDLKARKKVSQAFRDFQYAAKKKADSVIFSTSNNLMHSSHATEKTFCQDHIKRAIVADNAHPSYHAMQTVDLMQGNHIVPEIANQSDEFLESIAHNHQGDIRLLHPVTQLSNYYEDVPNIQNKNSLVPAKIVCQNKETCIVKDDRDVKSRIKASQTFCTLPNSFTKKTSSGLVIQPRIDQFEKQFSAQGLSNNDVLLGRGNHKHHGNIQFRHLLAQYLTEYYEKANLEDKNALIYNNIVAKLRNLDPPGRFMHHNKVTGCWEEVGDLTAAKKVARAFRDLCHPEK